MGNLSQSKGECIGKIMLKMTSNRNKNMILGTLMSNYKFVINFEFDQLILIRLMFYWDFFLDKLGLIGI